MTNLVRALMLFYIVITLVFYHVLEIVLVNKITNVGTPRMGNPPNNIFSKAIHFLNDLFLITPDFNNTHVGTNGLENAYPPALQRAQQLRYFARLTPRI